MNIKSTFFILTVFLLLGGLHAQAESPKAPRVAEYSFDSNTRSLGELNPAKPKQIWKRFIGPKGHVKSETHLGEWLFLAPVLAIHPPPTMYSETLRFHADGRVERVEHTSKLVSGLPNPKYRNYELVKRGRWERVGDRIKVSFTSAEEVDE